MNRAVGLVIVAALLVVAWLGYDRPELFPGRTDIPQLVWLIMALMLVSGAGFGFWRFREDSGRALAGIVFWAVLIVAITLAYPLFN
jgi:asparagine N-glycosylation enzyme membrane subunit Stt3